MTTWFNVEAKGQTITASLKDPSNANFYGHTYSFIIETKVKKGANLSRWKQGNQYIIPNVAKFIIDNRAEKKTNKREVYINPDDNGQVVNVPYTLANIPLYVKIIGLVLLIGGVSAGIYVSKGGNFSKLKAVFKK